MILDYFKQKMAQMKGTYVSVPLVNKRQFVEFFQDQGVDVVTDAHCTIAYSRRPFNHKSLTAPILVPSYDLLSIEPLGDEGALVLKFNNDVLQERHARCMKEGASHDYDSYITHITITYTPFENYKNLKIPNFNLIFGAEKVEPLNVDYKK